MDNRVTASHAQNTIFIRDYVYSFFAFFGFLAASQALTPTIPIYLSRLGTTEGKIGIIFGVFGVASLLSRFLAGALLRKYPERRVMLWAAGLFIAVYLSFTVFRPFWPFFAVRLIQGLAFACFDTAAIAYVIRIVPLENRARAISYLLVASPLSSALVASASVFVVNEYGFALLAIACTGISICTFFLCTRLKLEITTKRQENTVVRSAFFETRIFAPAITSFLFSFTWGGLGAFFPLYAIQCGVKNPGHFFTAMAIVLIAARLAGGRILDRYSEEKILPVVILISMSSLLILSISKSQPVFIVIGMLWGIGGGFLPPVSLSYAIEYAGTSDGTAVGTYQAFMDLGFGIGPMIMGVIVPFTGYPVMFLCLAFVCLINACYFQYYLKRKYRTLRARTDV